MTTRSFQIKAVVSARTDVGDQLRLPGDAALVNRGTPRWLIVSCPCGCGDQIPINLDPRSGPAWEYYGDNRFGITIFPSIWRDTGCRSHFIIWYGQISLFDNRADEGLRLPQETLRLLREKVREQLLGELVHFREISARLNAIPWDVQHVCRELVDEGYAREGSGKKKGFFSRCRWPFRRC